jgi:hypothetical protein
MGETRQRGDWRAPGPCCFHDDLFILEEVAESTETVDDCGNGGQSGSTIPMPFVGLRRVPFT